MSDPAAARDPEALERYLELIEAERDRRPAEAMLADEINRLRMLVESPLTFRDLEMKIRDGSLHLHAVGSVEGGAPAYRLVAALLLHVLLGDENGMPPNYRAIEWSIKPADTFETMRICAEVVNPGGKSSHEIRRELEAQIEQLQAAAGAVDG